jgi:hypothetical protein
MQRKVHSGFVYRVEKSNVLMEDTREKDLDLRLSKRSLEFFKIQQVRHVEQELPTLPEQLSSLLIFSGFRVARSLVFCIMFCISLSLNMYTQYSFDTSQNLHLMYCCTLFMYAKMVMFTVSIYLYQYKVSLPG